MTIFDSIRYPISDNPTLDELHALPSHFREEYNRIVLSTYRLFNQADLYRKIILEWDTQ